ncbi:hypothetical protein BaRGS_00019849 [Batillaria attramentaria]|uniref:Uncharacterized protein n=1 Tax=Batillaria attramentaria TaxID=370345 RepID=A0ABD0KPW3_9CAEN
MIKTYLPFAESASTMAKHWSTPKTIQVTINCPLQRNIRRNQTAIFWKLPLGCSHLVTIELSTHTAKVEAEKTLYIKLPASPIPRSRRLVKSNRVIPLDAAGGAAGLGRQAILNRGWDKMSCGSR